jgi:Rad3-related DNA helicase
MYLAHPGKYLVFFPSYAYLRMVQGLLAAWAPALPLHVQDSGMDDAARSSFLARFTDSTEPLLALCVLGGVFAEGIDLPGLALIGVCVVGVGLPQVNGENEALRAHYQLAFGSGYGFAYRYPGMHKVLQAAGRVIRSEEDRGVVLLLDDRYAQAAYRELLPEHYRVRTLRAAGDIGDAVRAFWS